MVALEKRDEILAAVGEDRGSQDEANAILELMEQPSLYRNIEKVNKQGICSFIPYRV
jgi:hypothetical protein